MISKGLQKVWTLLNLRSLQFRAIFTGTVSKLFHASSCFLEQAIAQTTCRILVSRLYSLSFLHSLLIGSTLIPFATAFDRCLNALLTLLSEVRSGPCIVVEYLSWVVE